MSQPCHQEQPLRELNEKVIAALREIREDQKQQTTMLTALSVQDERIRHVETNLDEIKDNQKEIFQRLREIELLPGKTSSKALWGIYGAATGGVASLMTGIIVFIVTRG